MNEQTGVVVLIQIRGIQDREDEARQALIHAIETSEKPGMSSSRVFADVHDASAFFAIQEWDSIESFRAHMNDVESGFEEATSMLAGQPQVKVLREIHSVTA
ncbi:MAG: antibiotic biosynthesis monooxygenase [Tomitella sp.]|nr:antibiotic biosynthesis monooxygenase [Tomitella sp.]